jgi:hypothetical protein
MNILLVPPQKNYFKFFVIPRNFEFLFGNSSISEINVISVEVAKVVGR